MKKIFTLLVALLCVSLAYAQTYEFYYNGGTKTYNNNEAKTFYKVNGNDKTGSTAVGTFVLPSNNQKISATKGLKVNSSGYVEFTLQMPGTLTVFLSANQSGSNLPGLNGVAFSNDDLIAVPSSDFSNVRILEKKLGAGEYKFSYAPQNKEICLFYIGVVIDEITGVQLDAPEIIINTETGEVTLGAVENAVKIVYTTDGSMPTEESTEYTEPFTVEDGTVVKAVAIGDGDAIVNSIVASETVYLTGFQVATPVIKQINGTFTLSCSTPYSYVEFSYDNSEWSKFTTPQTLFESKTIYARATRENCITSETVSEIIEALPAVKSDKTIYFGWGSFNGDATGEGKFHYMVGKEGDDAEGYTLTCGTADKAYSSGSKFPVIDRSAIKLSNGAPNTLKIKEGFAATRIVLYSTVNLSKPNRTSYWREIKADGVALDVNNIEMSSYLDYNNPDIRVYNLDNASEITFTNTGEQLFVAFTLEVVDLPALTAPWHYGATEENSYKPTYNVGDVVRLLHADPEATIIYTLDGGDPDEKNIYVEEAPEAAPARAAAETVADVDHTGKTYSQTTHPIVFNGEALNIAYKAVKDGYKPSEIQTLSIGDNGETTGIENVAVETENNAPVEFFNLQGIRVENPSNGIFIRRQGKTINKVIVK